MRWDDDPIRVGIFLFAIGILMFGCVVGSGIMIPNYITEGRNQGIVFCSEKPKECVVEYQYIKLKGEQK
jgi:hypothetical protein